MSNEAGNGRSFSEPERDDSVTFLRASRLELGIILEGEYVGSQPNTLEPTKTDFKFQLDDGSNVIVNGAGNLGYRMKVIELGDYVQIVYEGKQEIKKGNQAGKEAHNFKVLRAD